MSKRQYIWPTIMWSFGAFSFLLQYACRIAPSTILDPLSVDFGLDATQVGMIGTYFLLPYVGMQLFVGRIVDRFPAHHVLIATTLIFFFANQFFSEATTMVEVAASRALMGAVGAFAFVVTMKLALIWFENRFLGVLAGLTQVSGMVGAIFGGQITDYLMIGSQWRPVIKALSMLMGILVLLMVIVMKDKPSSAKKEEDVGIVEGIITVWKNPQSWFNGLYAGLIYLPTAGFGEYWGQLYLTKTNTMMDSHTATVAISMIFVGWAIGGIVSGWLSDYMRKRKPLMFIAPIMCMATLLPVVYIHNLSAIWVYGLLMLYGLFNSPLVLSYAISGEINPKRVSGVSIAFCNMSSILLGTAVMPLMGWMMDMHATISDSGSYIYTASAYESAVILFPISLVLAFICALMIKETNCQAVSD